MLYAIRIVNSSSKKLEIRGKLLPLSPRLTQNEIMFDDMLFFFNIFNIKTIGLYFTQELL